MAFNDDITDAGEAFIGAGQEGGPSVIGNVQLWNPFNSGKNLYLDCVTIAAGHDVGGDIRYCNVALSTEFAERIRNKSIDGPESAAQIRIYAGAQPSVFPYNYPVYETWWGGPYNDRTYTWNPPIKIPQGRGVVVGTANNSHCYASFQFREKDTDPVSSSPPAPGMIPGNEGTIVSNGLTNPANAFDGDPSTYATDPNDSSNTNYYIGKTWTANKTVTRFVLKSELGRSFSAANPGRILNWDLKKFDGTNWVSHQTGTYTEPGTGSTQSILDVTLTTPCTALGHRIHITESNTSTQHIGAAEFYE